MNQRYGRIIEKHQKKAPVKLLGICQELGIRLSQAKGLDPDISGVLKRHSSGVYQIIINADHPPTRQRFTIAHEIAHFILHQHLIDERIVDGRVWRRRDLMGGIEREANQLAADILMPWHLLNAELEDECVPTDKLAEAFAVSESAMAIRLGIIWH